MQLIDNANLQTIYSLLTIAIYLIIIVVSVKGNAHWVTLLIAIVVSSFLLIGLGINSKFNALNFISESLITLTESIFIYLFNGIKSIGTWFVNEIIEPIATLINNLSTTIKNWFNELWYNISDFFGRIWDFITWEVR